MQVAPDSMLKFYWFQIFFFFLYGTFYLNKCKTNSENLFYLKCTHLTSSTYVNLKTRLFCIKQQYRESILELSLFIVKITDLHWLYSCNSKKTKKQKNKTWNKTKMNKKHVDASVFWFGPFHQLTVPGFIFGCMAQFPLDTKSGKITPPLNCKFTVSLIGT